LVIKQPTIIITIIKTQLDGENLIKPQTAMAMARLKVIQLYGMNQQRSILVWINSVLLARN